MVSRRALDHLGNGPFGRYLGSAAWFRAAAVSYTAAAQPNRPTPLFFVVCHCRSKLSAMARPFRSAGIRGASSGLAGLL